MNLIPGQFQYDPSLIKSYPFTLASPDLLVLTLLGALIAIFFLLHIFLPYLHGYVIVKKEEQLKLEKKKTIQDLIMMKEIQTELEKEIEQAMLKNSLKSH